MVISNKYKRKLLIPGWAGEVNPEELDYIVTKLRRNSELRRKWGFVKGRRRISRMKVKKVAMYGLLDSDDSDSGEISTHDLKAERKLEGKLYGLTADSYKQEARATL